MGGGLPAGAGDVILGFVLGPNARGRVEPWMLAAVEPAAPAARGGLAFGLGLQYGFHRGRRVGAARMLGSWTAFLFTGAAIAAAVWGVLRLAVPAAALGPLDRVLLAGGRRRLHGRDHPLRRPLGGRARSRRRPRGRPGR